MKLNVAVFFGGESVEHEVSIISAYQAINALDRNQYHVIPIYVGKDRRLYYSELLYDISTFQNLQQLMKQSIQVTLSNEKNKIVIRPVKAGIFSRKEITTIDVAIPVMHGTNGEDGTIQGYFEMLKLPYAGCDLYGAAIGQDKVLQKHILHDNDLPITNWFWVYSSDIDNEPEVVLRKVHKLIYPVIIKPARTGSSIGISIAHNDEEYIQYFNEARQYDEKIITEKVVKPLREINCSVLGNPQNAQVSVLEEVSHSVDTELLDFNEKYGKESSKGMASTKRVIPAPLDELMTKQIQNFALKTFRLLGGNGVCRIDFMMDAETKKVYVNEINTIPGSLSFYLWSESGLSFSQLMDRLIQLALERERKRNKMVFSYETNILQNFSLTGVKGIKGSKN